MCTPKDRRQIPCLRLQPFPSSVGKPQLVSTRFALGFCCRSLISLVSSRLQGNKLHCTALPQPPGQAAAQLRESCSFTGQPPSRWVLEPTPSETHHSSRPSISPSPRSLAHKREVPTPSRTVDPHSPDLSTCSREGVWSPVAGSLFPSTNRRFLDRIDSSVSLSLSLSRRKDN